MPLECDFAQREFIVFFCPLEASGSVFCCCLTMPGSEEPEHEPTPEGSDSVQRPRLDLIARYGSWDPRNPRNGPWSAFRVRRRGPDPAVPAVTSVQPREWSSLSSEELRQQQRQDDIEHLRQLAGTRRARNRMSSWTFCASVAASDPSGAPAAAYASAAAPAGSAASLESDVLPVATSALEPPGYIPFTFRGPPEHALPVVQTQFPGNYGIPIPRDRKPKAEPMGEPVLEDDCE